MQPNCARYQLRYAAGQYWLLDMEQQESEYVAPIVLNETGAVLWKALEQGKEVSQLSNLLVLEYGVSQNQAVTDIDMFLEQLRNHGVMIQG